MIRLASTFDPLLGGPPPGRWASLLVLPLLTLLGSTAIGSGVAIPHCKMENLRRVEVAIGLSREGVEFESEDGRPVQLFFLVVSPTDSPAAHLRALAAISKWVKADRHVERLLALEEPEEIWQLLKEGGG